MVMVRIVLICWLLSSFCTKLLAVAPTDWPYCCVANITGTNRNARGECNGGSATLIGVNETTGIMATANHVVERDSALRVVFPNGYKCNGKVIGRNPQLDLAAISIRVQAGMPTPRCPRLVTQRDGVLVGVGYPYYGHDREYWTIGKFAGMKGHTVLWTARPYTHSGYSGGAVLTKDGSLAGVIRGYQGEYCLATGGQPMIEFFSRWVSQ